MQDDKFIKELTELTNKFVLPLLLENVSEDGIADFKLNDIQVKAVVTGIYLKEKLESLKEKE